MAKKRRNTAKRRTAELPPVSSPEETATFIRELQREFPTEPRSRVDKERLRAYLADVGTDRLQALMRRAVISLVQHRQPPEVPRRRDTGSSSRRSGRQRR